MALSQTIPPLTPLCQTVYPLSTSKHLAPKETHLGPSSPEAPAPRPGAAPAPRPQAGPSRLPALGLAGRGLRARPPSHVGGACARPPSCPLSPGVIKSEIPLPVTPVLWARADLHMKGPRRAWAFSFSHSQ